MTDSKQSARFKSVVRVLAISVAVLIPTAALAHFCGQGRMTGGGKLIVADNGGTQFDITNGFVTNGYELHCDGSGSNNLEVNGHDPNGSKFKLDTLLGAFCHGDDSSTPPAAGFSIYEGVGNGTWKSGNDSQSACAEWVFVDGQGGPQNNKSYIRVTTTDPLPVEGDGTNLCPADVGVTSVGKCPGPTVLLVPLGTPLRGQNQAHK
jgi:hypothetical protein